jgi:hypothetical protein
MKLLILVHGMGINPPGWSASVKKKLDEVAGQYAAFAGGNDFSRQVSLAEVSYDGIFARELQGWDLTADTLARYAKAKKTDIGDLTAWMNGAADQEKNFFWSHCVDVMFYHFFKSIRTAVRVNVMKQIAEAVNAARAQGPVDVSVLAHSLGTSVAHDALAILGATALNQSQAFLAGKFQFENIFMVANVSRCLETTELTGTSCVFPGSMTRKAYCSRYYNFKHILDPILVVRPWKDANWGTGYTDIADLDHVRDINVHGFEHYLDSPRVHIPIIKGLLGPVIPDDEAGRVTRHYPSLGGPGCPGEVAKLRDFCRRTIGLIGGETDPANVIKAGAQFLAQVKELQDACGHL